MGPNEPFARGEVANCSLLWSLSACAEGIPPSAAAATLVAAAPRNLRRSNLVSVDIFLLQSVRSLLLRWSQRPERRPHLLGEHGRLFPGGKVAAFLEPVVINELWICLFRPAPRGLIELVWKGADAGGDGNVLRREERQFALPVETSRGDLRVRQPIERDVVEDVVPCQALGLAVEDARDERLTRSVVVEHPRGQAER